MKSDDSVPLISRSLSRLDARGDGGGACVGGGYRLADVAGDAADECPG